MAAWSARPPTPRPRRLRSTPPTLSTLASSKTSSRQEGNVYSNPHDAPAVAGPAGGAFRGAGRRADGRGHRRRGEILASLARAIRPGAGRAGGLYRQVVGV